MKSIILDYPPHKPSHEDHSDLHKELRKLASQYKITFVTTKQQVADEENLYRDKITKLWSDAKNDFSITANDLIDSFVKIAEEAYIQGLQDGLDDKGAKTMKYQLKVTFKDFVLIWGPYDTREQAVAVLIQNEYRADILDIELKVV